MLRAIILGIIQGLTEFLPVSSSGHLVVTPYLFSWETPGLPFDVALHAGTLVAVVGYFAADLWYLATRSLGVGTVAEGEAARARRTIGLLAVGSVPAAIAGFTLEDVFADAFERPVWVAGFFLVTAGLLTLAETVRARRARRAGAVQGAAVDEVPPHVDPGRDETTIGFVDTITIGLFQAFALFPGISRSGSTIAGGMLRGLSREASARFSFLLMIPAVAGATVLKLPELFDNGNQVFTTTEIIAGMVAAAVSGFWAIRYLLKLVQTDDLKGFARYLVFFSILILIGRFTWIGPPTQG